ncbi:MAG: response regulator [Coriobacteriales bacterium]|nr:response regulator [Actinomycetes bacterium]
MAKILVVDDEPNIQKLLTVALTNRGHTVLTADNGVEALASVEFDKPDLVVLDVMMPKMNGHQVREEIRKRGNTVPILFLSAAGTFEEQAEQMQDEQVDYIPKPFKPSEVAEHIDAMLDPKRREEVARERAKREAKLHTIVNIMHRDRE